MSPDTFIYVCFYFLLGRCTYEWVWSGGGTLIILPVYCNSLLATLNVRNAIRERGHNDLGISLRQLSDSNNSTVDNHKVAGSVLPVIALASSCCSLMDLIIGSQGRGCGVYLGRRNGRIPAGCQCPRSKSISVTRSVSLSRRIRYCRNRVRA